MPTTAADRPQELMSRREAMIRIRIMMDSPTIEKHLSPLEIEALAKALELMQSAVIGKVSR